MPSLRDYRDRIASVKSTRKITSAMARPVNWKTQDKAETSQPRKSDERYDGPRAKELVGGSTVRHCCRYRQARCASARCRISGPWSVWRLCANIIRANAQSKSLLTKAKKSNCCVGRKAYDAFRRAHEQSSGSLYGTWWQTSRIFQ